jgi:acetoacetyl-CoA synthetase
LWKLAADTGATLFGASPTFVQMMEKAGLEPGMTFDLSRLECVMAAGAPSTPETFAWFYRSVKKDLWVTSQSGGTEICSGFVGASPTLPVYAGEIQKRMLGMDVHSWSDDGKYLVDEVGELVVTSPFPSMPIRFWNDAKGERYHESYFDTFPGVWRHGDFIKINARGGCYIYGRSDSTLNRFGVRIGTAEIYRAVEQEPEVADSLIVCCELPGGNFFMPLFLRLKPEFKLTEEVEARINRRLRQECSPRHVPDRAYEDGGAGPQDPDGRASRESREPRRNGEPGIDRLFHQICAGIRRLFVACTVEEWRVNMTARPKHARTRTARCDGRQNIAVVKNN